MTDRRKKARQERTERLGKKQVCQTQEFSHGLNVRFVFCSQLFLGKLGYGDLSIRISEVPCYPSLGNIVATAVVIGYSFVISHFSPASNRSFAPH